MRFRRYIRGSKKPFETEKDFDINRKHRGKLIC